MTAGSCKRILRGPSKGECRVLSVIEILDDIAAGRDSAEAAIARSRALIESRDGALGAFAALAPAGTTIAEAGPLAGIAVGVKDIFETHDMPTAYGSPIYAGNQPVSNAAIVAMLRARGAFIIGKTVTTEFAFLYSSKTINPRNSAHTPGGSSSGSAAAVAAGMIPAAIGTQTGGSIIRPAAFCGVAGFKPSFRLFPAIGMKTFSWSMDTIGFFAASVRDVARLSGVLSGRDLEADEPREAPRIGLFRSATWNDASDDMRSAVLKAADIASRSGANVVEIDEPVELTRGRDIHATIQNFEAAIANCDDLARHADAMSEILRTTLEEGQSIAPQDYDNARRIARHARKASTALFNDIDVLLTPSAPGAAPLGLGQTGSPLFNKVWTLTGNPCVNVPGMTDGAGMPLGLQVVGRFGRDKLALQCAAWLEKRIGG
jgi:Asp-tRNA(Asn)/Glu-tRNA(Gln) amidotransferase A subunit family amidase